MDSGRNENRTADVFQRECNVGGSSARPGTVARQFGVSLLAGRDVSDALVVPADESRAEHIASSPTRVCRTAARAGRPYNNTTIQQYNHINMILRGAIFLKINNLQLMALAFSCLFFCTTKTLAQNYPGQNGQNRNSTNTTQALEDIDSTQSPVELDTAYIVSFFPNNPAVTFS